MHFLSEISVCCVAPQWTMQAGWPSVQKLGVLGAPMPQCICGRFPKSLIVSPLLKSSSRLSTQKFKAPSLAAPTKSFVFLGFGGAPHPLDSLNAQTVFGRDMEYR